MQARISRRDFFAGSALAASGVVIAGQAVCAQAQEESSQPDDAASTEVDAVVARAGYDCWVLPQGEPSYIADPIIDIAQTEDFEVVVCGLGAAGTAAAATAVGHGLKTVVLQKGSTHSANPGDLSCYNTKIHQIDGYEAPTKDEVMEVYMLTGGYRNDARKVVAYYDRSGEAFDWLYDNVIAPAGLVAVPELMESFSEGWVRGLDAGITWENGRADASAVHESLVNYIADNGGDIRYSTPAVQLVTDEDGRVTGVIGKNPDGTFTQFNASRGVILCTGGYEHNFERMKRFMRPSDYATIATSMNPVTDCTGDGQDMAVAIGAAEDEAPHAFAGDPGGLVTSHGLVFAVCLPWMRVTDRGERFTNETVSLNALITAIISP